MAGRLRSMAPSNTRLMDKYFVSRDHRYWNTGCPKRGQITTSGGAETADNPDRTIKVDAKRPNILPRLFCYCAFHIRLPASPPPAPSNFLSESCQLFDVGAKWGPVANLRLPRS